VRLPPAATHRLAVVLLWALTLATLGALLLIIGFILYHGLPQLSVAFFTQRPRNMGRDGGVLPVILGTLYITGLAVLIAGPVGIATAVYLTEYTRPGRLTRVIRFGADCLAGIPSIIFGLFGYAFFVVKSPYTLGLGFSVLSGSLTLAMMVLPTIIRTSEEAIRAVPESYRDVSFGLGSSRWQMVTQVVLRSALPGIGTGVVLSIGRCLSETAAVMFTAGMALGWPQSVFDSSRTLALHFYVLFTEGISTEKAYATASVLILAILGINLLAYWLMRRFIGKVQA
jgi:phosphate transport system permease protein